MNAKLLGFFSGFPTHHFTDRIADALKEELNVRDSLVFIRSRRIIRLKRKPVTIFEAGFHGAPRVPHGG